MATMSARVRNAADGHEVEVSTGEARTILEIAAKSSGRGSGVSGGELLLAALATCLCNDLFREAEKRDIELDEVEVEAEAEFPAEGVAARGVTCRVRLSGSASPAVLRELTLDTDKVAEIQNTVRAATAVTLQSVEVPDE